jgi:HK97 family phage major capsid protein
MNRLERLRETVGDLSSQMRAMLDAAESRGDSNFSGEESRTWRDLNRRHDEAVKEIRHIEEHNERERKLAGERPYDVLWRGDPAPRDVPVMPTLREYREHEARALSEGTASAGGYLVPDQYVNSWFDMLRASSVVLSAGPVIIEATSDTVRIPRVSAGTTVGMVAENAAITPADPTFAEVSLTPKKAAAFTLCSNEALEDSSPSVREVLARDHIAQLGIYLDSQFLGVAGTGAGNNMRGLKNFTGATSTSAGALNLDDIADALGRLEVSNAAGSRLAIFMAPRDWAHLRKLKDTSNKFLLSPDPTQDSVKRLFGIPVYISSQIPTNLGGGTNESWIVVADMNQVAIAQRKAITVEYSTQYAFNADQTAVRTLARYDIAPINVAGVEVLTAVTLA